MYLILFKSLSLIKSTQDRDLVTSDIVVFIVRDQKSLLHFFLMTFIC